jgi:WD40 repeat protein
VGGGLLPTKLTGGRSVGGWGPARPQCLALARVCCTPLPLPPPPHTHTPRGLPAGHEGRVTGLAALPGQLLLSCSEDRSLRVWDLQTMKQLHVSRLAPSNTTAPERDRSADVSCGQSPCF